MINPSKQTFFLTIIDKLMLQPDGYLLVSERKQYDKFL